MSTHPPHRSPLQIRANYADLYSEALRIRAGRPTLRLSCSLGGAGGPTTTGSLGGSASGEHAGVARDGAGKAGELQPEDPRSVLDRHLGSAASFSSGDGDASGGSTPCSGLGTGEGEAAAPPQSPFRAWSAVGFERPPPAGGVAACAAAWPASRPLALGSMLSGALGSVLSVGLSMALSMGLPGSSRCGGAGHAAAGTAAALAAAPAAPTAVRSAAPLATPAAPVPLARSLWLAMALCLLAVALPLLAACL